MFRGTAMEKLKVGDRARQVKNLICSESPECTITEIDGDMVSHKHDSGGSGFSGIKDFVKMGGKMDLRVYGEEEVRNPTQLRLIKEGDEAKVVACDGSGETVFDGVLVIFRPDGRIKRASGVDRDLGFILNSNRQIEVFDEDC